MIILLVLLATLQNGMAAIKGLEVVEKNLLLKLGKIYTSEPNYRIDELCNNN